MAVHKTYWGSIEDSAYMCSGEHNAIDLIEELQSPTHTVYECKVTEFQNAPYNGHLSAEVVKVHGAQHNEAQNIKRFEMRIIFSVNIKIVEIYE